MLTTLISIVASIALIYVVGRFALSVTKASPLGHTAVWGLMIFTGIVVPYVLGEYAVDMVLGND